jgi:hypothetical protein
MCWTQPLHSDVTMPGSFVLYQQAMRDLEMLGAEASENGVLKRITRAKSPVQLEYFNQSTLPCTRALSQAHTSGEQLPHFRTRTSSPRTISRRARACVEASDSTRTGGGTTNEEEGSRGWQANPADGARDSALVRDDAHSHRSRDGWGMAAAPGADRTEGIVGGRGTRTNIRFPFKGHHASLIRVRSVVLLFWVREQVTCYALIFLSLPLVDATRHHDFRAT